MLKFNTRNAINANAIANGAATVCAKSNLQRVSSDATHFYLLRGMSVSAVPANSGISTRIARADDQSDGTTSVRSWRFETRIGQIGQSVKRALKPVQLFGLGMPITGRQMLGTVASEPTARLSKS